MKIHRRISLVVFAALCLFLLCACSAEQAQGSSALLSHPASISVSDTQTNENCCALTVTAASDIQTQPMATTTWYSYLSPEENAAVLTVTEFLEKRARSEWLFEDHDLSHYIYHGTLMQSVENGSETSVYYEWPEKALSNYLDLIDNRRQYRMALGKDHTDFSVTYNKIQCDYDPGKMKITVRLDEHIQYLTIPGNNAPTLLGDTFVITLTETGGSWQIIEICPQYDWEYESIKNTEYDKETELSRLLALAAEITGANR